MHMINMVMKGSNPSAETAFLHTIPIFIKGKVICNFLLYRYEKGSKKAKLREQMLPTGQQRHLVVLVFVPATPTP